MALATALNAVKVERLKADFKDRRRQSTDYWVGLEGDGVLTAKELARNFQEVAVNADRMLEVLDLENDLMQCSWKMPNFCLCLACFILALVEFSPPNHLYDVNRRLDSHFHLSKLTDIKTIDDVFGYVGHFEERNEVLQATSYKYWCERRYAVHRWDEHLMIPVHECPSPRLYALQLLKSPEAAWKPSDGGSSGRLSSSSGSGSSSSASSSASSNSTPVCANLEEELKLKTADANATCFGYAVDPSHSICEDKHAMTLCPETCGFCPPYQYDHVRRFDRPQVTMFPVMIYQKRFMKADCHGFAQVYEAQKHNPALIMLPALDGRRNAEILTCIDRSKRQESEHALELKCTPDTPAYYCKNGKVLMTRKHTFLNEVIYPILLVEPHRDIERMKQVEWIDLQTESFSLSTVVYTEGVEVFSSLTVEFKMDVAGNVDGHFRLVSYHDLHGTSRSIFVACLCTCIAGGFVGVILSIYNILKFPTKDRRFLLGFELLSRLLLVVYPVVLLVGWSLQTPMAAEFEQLLHTFLDLPSVSEARLDGAIQQYFDTKSHMHEENTWLERHCGIAYWVCYVQFLQMIFYFNAHPKMAVLTATVRTALSNLGHFAVLFSFLYLMLGFMAHWMLGPHLKEFGTMSNTVRSQARMLAGEFIQANQAEALRGQMLAMYWLYAMTFLLVMVWTLMNFFLAIIVDAFVEIRERNSKCSAARDLVTDLVSVWWARVLSWRCGWPKRRALLKYFNKLVDVPPPSQEKANTSVHSLRRASSKVRAKSNSHKVQVVEEEEDTGITFAMLPEIHEVFGEEFQSRYDLAVFLMHYYGKDPRVLLQMSELVMSRRAISAEEEVGTGSETPVGEEAVPSEDLSAWIVKA